MPGRANFWQQLRVESSRHRVLSAPRALSPASPLRHVPSVHVANVPSDDEMRHHPPPPSIPPVAAFTRTCWPSVASERLSQTPPHFAFIPTSSRAGTVRAVCSDSPSPRRWSSCVWHAERHVRVRRGPKWHAKIASNLLPHWVRLSRAKKIKKELLSALAANCPALVAGAHRAAAV